MAIKTMRSNTIQCPVVKWIDTTVPTSSELTVSSADFLFFSNERSIKKIEPPVISQANISRSNTADRLRTKTQQIQSERQQQISDICAQKTDIRKKTSKGIPWKLNKKDKYLYCPIPKAGWSSWKRLWFYTSGVISSYETDVGIRSDLDAHVYNLKSEAQVQSAWKSGGYNFSFVFVRNPWERLVSAYINKAVEYNYSRILHTPCRWESMEPYKPDLTFEQFLTCIADGSREMHWAPQWYLCNICRIKFDFIGHMETVKEDAAFVLSAIGLKATYPHSFASTKYSTKEVMTEWYQSIPKSLLQRLAVIYTHDFELHGYSRNPPGREDLS
ncbi:carbohydrate sulfotransferase 14-like [Watersipora subatra]|uniref:carbohydrate sulfotransferase 14-like n=1 Tax=Watersipora subatra TaxID=2589382 RepID=UPI00355C9045